MSLFLQLTLLPEGPAEKLTQFIEPFEMGDISGSDMLYPAPDGLSAIAFRRQLNYERAVHSVTGPE